VTVALTQIAAEFARYANLTLGGGSATIAVLREQVLSKRKWITDVQFDLAYGLSRLTPGTNLLAFCTAVGFFTRKWLGAIVALLAASVPCSIIAVVATHYFEIWQTNALFRGALAGALAAAVAIMLNTAWVLALPHAKEARLRALLVVPGAIALVTFTHASSIQVLGVAAVLGFAWPARAEKTS